MSLTPLFTVPETRLRGSVTDQHVCTAEDMTSPAPFAVHEV